MLTDQDLVERVDVLVIENRDRLDDRAAFRGAQFEMTATPALGRRADLHQTVEYPLR